jgi:hypothetical protein
VGTPEIFEILLDTPIIPESGAFPEAEGYRDAGMTKVACDFCGFGIT